MTLMHEQREKLRDVATHRDVFERAEPRGAPPHEALVHVSITEGKDCTHLKIAALTRVAGAIFMAAGRAAPRGTLLGVQPGYM